MNVDEPPEWDYSSDYCDGCAELGMTTCSCEPDGFECGNCGAEVPSWMGGDICDECEEEQDEEAEAFERGITVEELREEMR